MEHNNNSNNSNNNNNNNTYIVDDYPTTSQPESMPTPSKDLSMSSPPKNAPPIQKRMSRVFDWIEQKVSRKNSAEKTNRSSSADTPSMMNTPTLWETLPQTGPWDGLQEWLANFKINIVFISASHLVSSGFLLNTMFQSTWQAYDRDANDARTDENNNSGLKIDSTFHPDPSFV